MLQNLKPNNRYRTMANKFRREVKKFDITLYKEIKKKDLGFERFIKYKPDGTQYTPDNKNDFTGVYVMDDSLLHISPFKDISIFTRSKSNGRSQIYGVCDNASQVIDLYNALFNNGSYDNCKEAYEYFSDTREFVTNSKIYKLDDKENYWKGNHVIILRRMNAFRWHKAGLYIGKYNSTHEYFSDEPGIDYVYQFDIYKVR